MNPLLTQILFNLVGSAVGDQSPQKNPNYLDENGNPVSGQQPFVSPNFGTRFFHPDVASQETQGNLATYKALIANAANNAVGGANASTVAPFIGKTFNDVTASNPKAAGILFPNQSTQGLLSGNTAALLQKANYPNLSATESTGNAVDTIRREAARLTGNVPEKEAGAQGAQADYTTRTLPPLASLNVARASGELANLPSELFRNFFGNVSEGEAARRNVSASNALDVLSKLKINTALSEGKVSEALGAAREETSPLLVEAQNSELRNLLWQLQHPELPPLPFYRNPQTGLPERNPAFLNQIEMMNAKLKGGATGTGHIPLGNGLNILPNNITSTNKTVNPLATSILSKNDLTPITRQVNVGTEKGSNQPDLLSSKSQLEYLKSRGSQPLLSDKQLQSLKTIGKGGGTLLQYLDMLINGQNQEDYYKTHQRF